MVIVWMIAEKPQALLAAMPTTPDRRPLTHAVPEIEKVQSVLSPSFTVSFFSDPLPTRKDVGTYSEAPESCVATGQSRLKLQY